MINHNDPAGSAPKGILKSASTVDFKTPHAPTSGQPQSQNLIRMQTRQGSNMYLPSRKAPRKTVTFNPTITIAVPRVAQNKTQNIAASSASSASASTSTSIVAPSQTTSSEVADRPHRRLTSPPPMHSKASDAALIGPARSGIHASDSENENIHEQGNYGAARNLSASMGSPPDEAVRGGKEHDATAQKGDSKKDGKLQDLPAARSRAPSDSSMDKRMSISQNQKLMKTSSGKIYDDKQSQVTEECASLPGREITFLFTESFMFMTSAYINDSAIDEWPENGEQNSANPSVPGQSGPMGSSPSLGKPGATASESKSSQPNNAAENANGQEDFDEEDTEQNKKKPPEYIPSAIIPLRKTLAKGTVQWNKINEILPNDVCLNHPVDPLLKQEWEINVNGRNESLLRHFSRAKYAHIELIDVHEDLPGDFPESLLNGGGNTDSLTVSLSALSDSLPETSLALSTTSKHADESHTNPKKRASSNTYQNQNQNQSTHTNANSSATKANGKFSPYVPRLSDLPPSPPHHHQHHHQNHQSHQNPPLHASHGSIPTRPSTSPNSTLTKPSRRRKSASANMSASANLSSLSPPALTPKSRPTGAKTKQRTPPFIRAAITASITAANPIYATSPSAYVEAYVASSPTTPPALTLTTPYPISPTARSVDAVDVIRPNTGSQNHPYGTRPPSKSAGLAHSRSVPIPSGNTNGLMHANTPPSQATMQGQSAAFPNVGRANNQQPRQSNPAQGTKREQERKKGRSGQRPASEPAPDVFEFEEILPIDSMTLQRMMKKTTVQAN